MCAPPFPPRYLTRVRYGRLELVKLLCSYGAIRDGREVAIAQSRGNAATAAWLAANVDNVTALHHADLVPPERARSLLRSGSDIHAARAPGCATPLSRALELEKNGRAPRGSTSSLIIEQSKILGGWRGRLARALGCGRKRHSSQGAGGEEPEAKAEEVPDAPALSRARDPRVAQKMKPQLAA